VERTNFENNLEAMAREQQNIILQAHRKEQALADLLVALAEDPAVLNAIRALEQAANADNSLYGLAAQQEAGKSC